MYLTASDKISIVSSLNSRCLTINDTANNIIALECNGDKLQNWYYITSSKQFKNGQDPSQCI